MRISRAEALTVLVRLQVCDLWESTDYELSLNFVTYNRILNQSDSGLREQV